VAVDCEEGDAECGSNSVFRSAVKNLLTQGTQLSIFEEKPLKVFMALQDIMFRDRRRLQAQTCGATSKVVSVQLVDLDEGAAKQTRNMVAAGALGLLEALQKSDKLICQVSLLNDEIKQIDVPAVGSQAFKTFGAGVVQQLSAASGAGSVEVFPQDQPANVLGPNHGAVINSPYVISIDGMVDGDMLKVEARGSKPQTNADGSLGTRTVTLNLLPSANFRYSSADAPIYIDFTPTALLQDMLVSVRVTNVLTGEFYDSLMFNVGNKARRRLHGKALVKSWADWMENRRRQ